MTDKEKLEKIRSEVIWYIHLRNEGIIIGSCGDFEKLLKFIDSMQEEPVSERLEDFAKRQADEFAEREYECGSYDRGCLSKGYYWGCKAGAKWKAEQFEKERLKHCDALTEEQAQIESDFVIQHLKKNSRTPTFVDAIEYGMRLKEKEMQSTIELAEDHAYFAGRTKTIDEINEALLSEVLPCFMHGGEADEVVAKLDEVLNQK